MSDLARQRRRRWARVVVRRGWEAGQVPRYGDETWCQMAQDDPRRIAAVVIAAEAWAQDGDDMEVRLAAELEAARQAEETREAEDFAVMAAKVRALATGPTRGELALRRGDCTVEELVQWEADHLRFVSGRTDEPARLPRREA